MSIKKQAENGRKAGGNQAVLNSIGTSRDSVETVGNTAESELRGGFFSQVSGVEVYGSSEGCICNKGFFAPPPSPAAAPAPAAVATVPPGAVSRD
jgi:hypothetical protein